MFRENKQTSENNNFPFWVLTLVGWTFFLACLQSYRKKSPDRSCLKIPNATCTNCLGLMVANGCMVLSFEKKSFEVTPNVPSMRRCRQTLDRYRRDWLKLSLADSLLQFVRLWHHFIFLFCCRQKWGANEGKYFEVKPVPNGVRSDMVGLSRQRLQMPGQRSATPNSKKNTGVSQHAFGI